ncbi:Fic family protein [Microbacterium limosum]|uniref:Fic family protein n=1 Tax=Microbacterium limosum TaxID=3079935 RepID=A0AAU0MFS3_9MICO|nr:Fic family protein [Microbacterium sp. Y20]WOQ69164.1 Fic family protein [Microbacterium sp. Y20]
MTWRPDEPYNTLPLLPPTVDIETVAVLKRAIDARAAVAALDQAALRMPNPAVLLNAIPILEAQASSEIENIVTTTDELFRYAQDESDLAAPETKETLRYRTALFAGLDSIQSRPLSATTAIQVCSTVQGREMDVRNLPGTIIANPVTRTAIYTPPQGGGVIREKLANWADFIHGSAEIDPLVRMAVAHYQFEAIHPFADGNGRTGRILNILMMVDAGLLASPILYLSRFIIAHKDDYYRLLLNVTRDGAWEPWVLFMLSAVEATATATLAKIDAIQALQATVRDQVRATSAGANSDLLDVLFEQPYARIANVIQRCGVSRPTATKWLNELVDAGVLRDVKAGRDRLFINHGFLEILTRDDQG